MSKFARVQTPTRSAPGPMGVTGPTRTHEGGAAHQLDAKSELFTLAVTNFIEPTFYESNKARQDRFVQAIARCTKEDPAWVGGLTKYTRDTMQMRSAAVVLACEYVKAGGPNGRAVVDSACVRADEPAEVLAYWMAKYGRQIPAAIKRGVADAARRLYNERSALRYDSQNASMRMADVLELCHVTPRDANQSQLFKWLIDRRHNRTERLEIPTKIQQVDAWVKSGAPLEPEIPELLSWERLSTYRKMDAAAWEAVIPNMGAMALVRNLRNFDEAGISDRAADEVIRRLQDAEEIRKSRQFPYRFYTAWRELRSLRWGGPLERALGHSTSNVPKLDGKTMVLIDLSASMNAAVSARSTVSRWEVGAVFAGVVAKVNPGSSLVCFGQHNAAIDLPAAGNDVLRIVDQVKNWHDSGRLGHATYMWTALGQHYDGENRVVIFTDDQAHDQYWSEFDGIPNIYTVDLAGYGRSGTDLNTPGRHRFAGFSDALFRAMPLLEQGRRGDWPWLQ